MRDHDEEPSVFNGHAELEFIIDRPVGEVWKQYLNLRSWIVNYDIENLQGEPGTLGSITRTCLKKGNEVGVPPAHYHYCKLIKVIPERQFLIKAYSEKGGSYGGEMTGYDDTRFLPLGDKTKIIFNFHGEFRTALNSNNLARLNADRTLNLDGSIEGMTRNLDNLKRIVEARG